MEVTRAVVFDLDDTLYLERDYVASGFRHVSNAVCEYCDAPIQEIFNFLWCEFEAGVRGDAFNRLIARYRSLTPRWIVEDLVEVYRSHQPVIELLPNIKELLGALVKARVRLALLTDGPVAAQSCKIAALGLTDWFNFLVLTDIWGTEYRKPHPRGFRTTMGLLGLPAEQLVYVGDNPEKDFQTPRGMGWGTVRLRLPGQLRCLTEPTSADCAAEREIGSIPSLTQQLSNMCALQPFADGSPS